MSVEAMTWAFQVRLKPCPKSVLVALANRADEDGFCWPGIEDLELRTGWKRRAIQQAIRELESSGLVSITPRFSTNGVQTSNLYRIAMPTTASGQGAPHAPLRVHQVRGEGAPHAPLRVHQVRGEGAPHAPKSSSEQSIEQSTEHSPHPPTGGACGAVPVSAQEFEQFWEAFPHKVGKKAAWRAWEKATDRPALVILLQAIDRAKKGERWQRGYIPNPATWLNQGRWADVVETPAAGPGLPKAYQPTSAAPVRGEACPPEVAAKLSRILGRDTFSWPAAEVAV